MNSLEITKNIMRTNKLFAKKSFGQNFLVDDNILSEIVAKSDVDENDLVIEIGPGLGNLTQYILNTGAEALCFEIDNDMIDVLNNRFKGEKRLKIQNTDILKVNLEEYLENTQKRVKVIANLPYYITTPILFKLLEYKERINSITVMVQKEVADRITAKPHSKDYGVLTINTNYLADVTKLFDVPNTSFIPAPNVTSSVIKLVIDNKKEESLGIKDKKLFNNVVKCAFLARRKKLANSITNSKLIEKAEIEDIIQRLGLNENCRAEELSIEEYAKLTNAIYEKNPRTC